MKQINRIELIRTISEQFGVGILTAQDILKSYSTDEHVPMQRERLAQAAMSGIISNDAMLKRFDKYPKEIFGRAEIKIYDAVARASVSYADALIRELNKDESDEKE